MSGLEALVAVPAVIVAAVLLLIDAGSIPPLKQWFQRRHK